MQARSLHGSLFQGLIDVWANVSFCQLHQGGRITRHPLFLDAVALCDSTDSAEFSVQL